MRTKLKLLFFISIVSSYVINAQSAKQLLTDMDQIIFGPKDKQGTIEIVLISKTGKEKIRHIDSVTEIFFCNYLAFLVYE